MKRNPSLQLRKIGSKYMIVNADTREVNMTDVYTLNETSARIWQFVDHRDFTLDEVVEWLCDEYEVSPELARQDLEALFADWKAFGMLL